MLHGCVARVQPPPVAVAEFVKGIAGSQASQGCRQGSGVLDVRDGRWWSQSKSAGSGCKYEEAHGMPHNPGTWRLLVAGVLGVC